MQIKLNRKDNSSSQNNISDDKNCSLEQIYRENYALMLNYGLNISNDIDLVEDCIQDVFVKLSVGDSLQSINSPRAYLLISLRHTLYNKLQSASERTKCSDFDEQFLLVPDTDDLFDTMFPDSDQRIRLKNCLKKALAQLTSQQKHVIYLRYIKNLSHKEVADIMEINVQSSMNLITRTLVKIRDLFKKEHLLLLLQLFHIMNHY